MCVKWSRIPVEKARQRRATQADFNDENLCVPLMIAPSRPPKLLGVQYLRAIAALMVAYLHLQIQIPQYTGFLTTHGVFDSARLKSGVDIFFVISGFIMFVTSRSSSPGEFAVRRLIRIVPLYWSLTLVLALVFKSEPQLFRATALNTEYLAKSLLFIPYANPGQGGDMTPLLVPGWTLNFEMFFYAIFTIVLFAPLQYRLAINGLIFLLIFSLGRWLHGSGPHSIITFYGNPQIFEFWAGISIGHRYLQAPLRLPRPACIALIAAGFPILLLNYHALPDPYQSFGDSIWCFLLPATAIVFGVISLESNDGVKHHWLPGLLGDASYSIYLSHIFVLGLARVLWPRLHLEHRGAVYAAAFAIFSMALTMLGGILSYWLLEKPMLNKLQAAYRRCLTPSVAVAEG